MRTLLGALLAIMLLVGAGYFLANHLANDEEGAVASTEFSKLVVALREGRNRLEVYNLKGEVTTVSDTSGGWGDFLRGEIRAKQPFTVSYFVDLSNMTLDDYIWDEQTRTLIVRAPNVVADPPNIDESRQIGRAHV